MLNKKRLKNLSLLKQKKLLNQKIEISTLDNEFEKNKTNKKKLKDILDNTSIDSTESAWNMKEKSQYKLKLIEQIYISDNRAKFFCCLALVWPNGKSFFSEGIVNGKISKKKKGKKGFGYDPIFVPKGYNKTFGEMEPKLKMFIDHRYKAYLKIKNFFG